MHRPPSSWPEPPPDRVAPPADFAAGPAACRKRPPPAMAWAARLLLLASALFLLQNARPLLLPVVIAVCFTFVLAPAVRAARRHGVPEVLGAALLIGGLLALIAALALALAAPAAQLWARAPQAVQQVLDVAQQARRQAFPPPPPTTSPPAARPADDRLSEGLASEGLRITRRLLGDALSFSVSASATVFLLYFLLISERWLIACTVQAVREPRSRARLLSGLRQAQRDIGLFITTMGLVSIGLGIATGIALGLAGFPNATLWGAATALLTFVPYIGPALVTLGLLGAGAAVSGLSAAMLLPAALFLGLHFIESNLLSPFIMGRRLRISPVFVFLSVLLWSWLWGIVGAFVAVPMLLGLRAACQRVPRLRLVRHYLEGGPGAATGLRQLVTGRPIA